MSTENHEEPEPLGKRISKLPLEVRRSRFVGEHISRDYFQYRRGCEPEFIKKLIDNVKGENPGKLTRALDVGCGSGQLTVLLAPYFEEVLGIDSSQTQIKEAEDNIDREAFPNVTFKLGVAENLPFEDNSVDLVTASSSFHWFDREVFMEEAKRVLVPNGVFAICSTGRASIVAVDIEIKNEIQNVIGEFYVKLGSEPSDFITAGTQDRFGYQESISKAFKDIQKIEHRQEYHAKLFELMKGLKTYPNFNAVYKDDPEGGEKAVQELTDKVKKVLKINGSTENPIITAERTNSCLIGRP